MAPLPRSCDSVLEIVELRFGPCENCFIGPVCPRLKSEPASSIWVFSYA
ncbi:unnamed protein product [Rhodiola kirilowii]